MNGATRARWTVVLPLKGGTAAKSRLGAPAALATAIALDCLDAVLASDQVHTVVVVTPDRVLAAHAAAAGAQVRTESTPDGGLLAAVADGLRAVPGRCAVLLGDLPALQPEDLTTALRRAAELLDRPLPAVTDTGTAAIAGSGARSRRPDMVFVPDADGTGTVLLTGRTAGAMTPSFGPASASAHRAAGAFRLDIDLPRLRRDVDTLTDLRTAVALGVGPRTRAALVDTGFASALR